MIAIGSYFVFVMFVLETVCDDPKISEEEKIQFFKDILREHNNYRIKHNSHILFLSDEMSKVAGEAVNRYAYFGHKETQGFNYSQKPFIESSILNSTLAKEIVADWYNTGADYNYDAEPSSDTADPFTRIIWEDSAKLGAALKWDENILYVVVSYSVVGNTKENNGYFRNVKKPLNSQ